VQLVGNQFAVITTTLVGVRSSTFLRDAVVTYRAASTIECDCSDDDYGRSGGDVCSQMDSASPYRDCWEKPNEAIEGGLRAERSHSALNNSRLPAMNS